MADNDIERPITPVQQQICRAAGLICTAVLAAVSSAVLVAHVTVVSVSSARLGAALTALLLFHLLRFRRIVFFREFALYALFLGYNLLSLSWARDVGLGMNTLVSAADFLLALILFGALMAYYDIRAVLVGALCGFVVAAALYTFTQGFPFSYPEDFSYNAIAAMYLFGLFLVTLFAWWTGSRIVSVSLALVLLVLTAATTSIKTNLGIVLGAAASGVLYPKKIARVIGRHAVFLAAAVGILAFVAASNGSLITQVETGLDRVALGVTVLSARVDGPTGTSFEDRTHWMREGLRGWMENPLFGHGVEAFRADFGITSHSTPVELLYNTGLIGLALFYSIFVSIAWRLFRARGENLGNLPALLFSGLVCYLFIALSGTMHYNSFLAVFVAVSVALLTRLGRGHAETTSVKSAACP